MSTEHPTSADVVADKTLQKALDFVSLESKQWVSDALACRLHNEGYQIKGNTEASDAQWLARTIWATLNPHEHHNSLERRSSEVQEEYLKIATACIKSIPQLAERIASRYIALSAAMRSEERILRTAREARR